MHPDTLTAMGTLAMSYDYLGQYEEARELLEKRLDLQRDVYGPTHPELIGGLNKLAAILDKQDRWNESGKYHRLAAQIAETAYGDDNTQTVSLMINVAINNVRQRNYREAEALFHKWAEPFRREHGDDHLEAIQVLKWYGILQLRQSRFAEARKTLEEVLELARHGLGPDHRETLIVTNQLAEVYEAMEARDAADHLRKELVASIAAHCRAGRWRQALDTPQLVRAVNVESDAEAMLYLAMANWQLGDHEKARGLYLDSVNGMGATQEKVELWLLRDEAAALLETSEESETEKN
jgi:tetratricopeptide (TPR) repeat protein